MPTILVRLDPTKLTDPDLDLRYEIPDLLHERSNGLITDAGYDYEPDTKAMQIYLETSDLETALPIVLHVLGNDRLHGNDLASAAFVTVSSDGAAAATSFTIVFPVGHEGVIRPPSQ